MALVSSEPSPRAGSVSLTHPVAWRPWESKQTEFFSVLSKKQEVTSGFPLLSAFNLGFQKLGSKVNKGHDRQLPGGMPPQGSSISPEDLGDWGTHQ